MSQPYGTMGAASFRTRLLERALKHSNTADCAADTDAYITESENRSAAIAMATLASCRWCAIRNARESAVSLSRGDANHAYAARALNVLCNELEAEMAKAEGGES